MEHSLGSPSALSIPDLGLKKPEQKENPKSLLPLFKEPGKGQLARQYILDTYHSTPINTTEGPPWPRQQRLSRDLGFHPLWAIMSHFCQGG